MITRRNFFDVVCGKIQADLERFKLSHIQRFLLSFVQSRKQLSPAQQGRQEPNPRRSE